jgi:hypothetical protein
VDEVTEEWRKLHNEELNDLYSSPNTVRMIKSRSLRYAWHVVLWGRGEVPTGFWLEALRERDLLARPRRRWDDNIKMYLNEVRWEAWTGLIWLRIGKGSELLLTRQ